MSLATMDYDAADRASEDDRLFFEAHPERRHRVRIFLPGELPVHGIAGDGRWFVAVRSIRPGVRARIPFYARRLPADTESEATEVFRIVFEGAAG